MAKEFAYGISGKLKIFTLLLGIVVIVLCYRSAFYNLSTEHEAFYISSIVCFVISLIIFLAPLIGAVGEHPVFRNLDMAYHLIAFVLLLVTGIIFIDNVARWTPNRPKPIPMRNYLAEQMSAGVIGIINALIYGIISALLIRRARGTPEPFSSAS